jgi:hypothetical protein
VLTGKFPNATNHGEPDTDTSLPPIPYSKLTETGIWSEDHNVLHTRIDAVCSLSGHFLKRCQAAMHTVVITVFDSVNITPGDWFNFASWPFRHGMKPIVLDERLAIGSLRARVCCYVEAKKRTGL